ncbi:hypothetical protein FEJ81_22040 (plasmid) [Natrinema versiforme]|uniref:Uncharacterized protein n=1 Tax=Natrinema versiforme TaxID=88724 RepID=A0A4P8WSD3_9EURY|nr:hypothetical protein FEJ81_22040 [Natrinema versiforme]
MIMPIITATLKYPDAVGEALMLQPPHNAACRGRAAKNGVRDFSRRLSRVRRDGEGRFRARPDAFPILRQSTNGVL